MDEGATVGAEETGEGLVTALDGALGYGACDGADTLEDGMAWTLVGALEGNDAAAA